MARRASTLGQATSRTESVPASVGGLDAVSSIAAMPPTNALVMDNCFPQTTFVQLRNGYVSQSTGLPNWVETLMGYAGMTGSEKLFGISGTAIYDCTTPGAVGAAVVTGLTNARWEYVNVATAGGAYLYAANAVDKPRLYDGTTWVAIDGGSTPAITGVTTTTLRNPIVWKSRVWFVQEHTNLAWYLPAGAVGGAAASLDLSAQFMLGGFLEAIMTFSLSSSTSFDDYIGFLSSEGELVVYQGSDPSDADKFARLGAYRMGKPIGRRCWFKYGADAVIICSDGLVSVARIIAVGLKAEDTVSYKIQRLINDAVQSYSTNFGWQGVVHPLGNKIVLNVPQVTNSRSNQFVMNTINGSWCSYGLLASAWNAATFCVLGDNLYFGGNTVVQRADVGQSDGGGQINGALQPAFGYCGTDRQKQFTMVRPVLLTTAAVAPAITLNVDFNTKVPQGIATFSATAAAVWGTALWGISTWPSGPTVQKNWQLVGGIGFAATNYMILASTVSEVSVLSYDYVFRVGGTL